MTDQPVKSPHCRLCAQGTDHTLDECIDSEEQYYERLRDDRAEAREQDDDYMRDEE